jgi:hypothetical protein
VLALLSLFAWPRLTDDPTGRGYLVNGLAYRDREPVPGQWIWVQSSFPGRSRAARVVAIAEQEVEWTGRRWRIGGNDVPAQYVGAFSCDPEPWRFLGPNHHVLVEPEAETRTTELSAPLIVVARGQIVGRVWARYDPFWHRSLRKIRWF